MLKHEPEEKSMNSSESALNPPVKYSSKPPTALPGTGEGTRKEPVTYLSFQSNDDKCEAFKSEVLTN